MIHFINNNLQTIFVTTETSWIEMPRMRHYVTQQLSLYFNVIFIQVDSSGFSKINKINNNLFTYKLGFTPRGIDRIYLLRRLWNVFQSFRIFLLLKKLRPNNPILFNFKFSFYQIYEYNSWFLKYYFINDDFINMPPDLSEQLKTRKRNAQNRVLTNCDRVFVSSEFLLNDNQRNKLNYSAIYSGHDFNIEYSKEKMKNNSKNRIELCLMGFINNNLELEWIDHLVSYDFFQIHFIGPVEDQQIIHRYKKNCNVYFHKPMTGSDLQITISKFDVMLMPYKPIDINIKASVPAKLLQYLACGKPVVSGIMPNLIELPDKFVYQSHDKFNFVESIIMAFEDDSLELFNSRCYLASKHTWNSRGILLSNIILTDFNNKSK